MTKPGLTQRCEMRRVASDAGVVASEGAVHLHHLTHQIIVRFSVPRHRWRPASSGHGHQQRLLIITTTVLRFPVGYNELGVLCLLSVASCSQSGMVGSTDLEGKKEMNRGIYNSISLSTSPCHEGFSCM